MWIKTNIDIGKVKERDKKTIVFENTEVLKEVQEIRPGCGGCTKVKGTTEKTVTVEYTAGSIPKHLELQGKKELLITKSLSVVYKDGQVDKLFFKGKIVK